MTIVAVLSILLVNWFGLGSTGAGLRNQCLDVEGAVDMPDVEPIPLLTNPIPIYPPLLLDAGIADTVEVSLVVGRDGSVDQSSYCVERPAKYSSLSASEVRQWRFSPAQHNAAIVAAKYRLVVAFAPRDTVRGPMSGARTLAEVHQPLLRSDRPRLTIGPMRLTFGVPRTGAIGDVGRDVEDSLVNRVLELANLNGASLVCFRTAQGSFFEWDGSLRATKAELMLRCGASASTSRAEIWVDRDDARASRHEGGLIRLPVSVRTYEFSHCAAGAFLCGGGLALDFDCEVRIGKDEEPVQCVVAERRHWIR